MKALKSALDTGQFDPVYLFHGSDDFLKEDKVRAVIARATDPSTRDFNLDLLRGTECDLAQLVAALEALPLLSERRVVVLRDPGALKKPARDRLERHLAAPMRDTVLVLVVPAGTKPDPSLTGAASAVEFKPLSEDDLLKWIAHQAESVCQIEIALEAAALLAAYGGNDLALLAGELQKLAAYTNGGRIGREAVEAVTGVRPGHTMGDLLDRAAARDTMGAVALVEEVLAQPKASAVVLVMALGTQALAIGWGLAARARGLSASRLESEYYGLLKEAGNAYPGRPWGEAVKCWARSIPKWSAADIDRALRHLLAADAALKDTRVSSEPQIVTSLLLAITPIATRQRAA